MGFASLSLSISASLVFIQGQMFPRGDNVTPRSQERPKISFSKKYAGSANGGIDGQYPEPRSVLHNRRRDQKLSKKISYINCLSLG